MKIRRLKIKNYKIFDDVEFDFTDKEGNTLDTIVLAGVNGSGKTTVLELIRSIFDLSFFTPEFHVGMEFEEGLEIGIEYDFLKEERLFLKEGVESAISYNSSEKDKFDYKLNDLLSLLNNDEKGYYFFIKKSPADSVLLRLIIQTNVVGYKEIFTMVYFPVLNREIQQYKKWAKMKILDVLKNKSDMKKSILKGIRDEIFANKNLPPKESIKNTINEVTKLLEGLNLNSKLVDFESEELIFESINGKRILFEDLSSGEQQIYFKSFSLSSFKAKSVGILVDEPATSLHPSWQQKIVKLYQNVGKNNQVFLATHSPHIIASVKPESLFLLAVNDDTRKVEVINMAKADQPTKGLEPNRVLQEIMGLESLRDVETQEKIDKLRALLTSEKFDSIEAKELIEELTLDLGRKDPFIMRLQNQLLFLERKRKKQTA